MTVSEPFCSRKASTNRVVAAPVSPPTLDSGYGLQRFVRIEAMIVVLRQESQDLAIVARRHPQLITRARGASGLQVVQPRLLVAATVREVARHERCGQTRAQRRLRQMLAQPAMHLESSRSIEATVRDLTDQSVADIDHVIGEVAEPPGA